MESLKITITENYRGKTITVEASTNAPLQPGETSLVRKTVIKNLKWTEESIDQVEPLSAPVINNDADEADSKKQIDNLIDSLD